MKVAWAVCAYFEPFESAFVFVLWKAVNELDLNEFKHGGANVTGFRLVDPDFDRVKEILKLIMKSERGSTGAKERLPVGLKSVSQSVVDCEMENECKKLNFNSVDGGPLS